MVTQTSRMPLWKTPIRLPISLFVLLLAAIVTLGVMVAIERNTAPTGHTVSTVRDLPAEAAGALWSMTQRLAVTDPDRGLPTSFEEMMNAEWSASHASTGEYLITFPWTYPYGGEKEGEWVVITVERANGAGYGSSVRMAENGGFFHNPEKLSEY